MLRRLAAARPGERRRRGARALKRRLATLRLGDPLDKNTDIGAINSAEQLAKIRELSEVGESEGAERWSPPCELPDKGFWFPPTVFTGVSQAHRIAREEIFGPVLSVLTFRTPEEAVEKANNTPYGLSAGVWTEKGSRILWMADRLRAGVVWANTFNRFDPAIAVRRLQGVGLRPRGRPPRAGGLPRCLMTRLRRPQDLQALHRRRVPPLRVGRSYVVTDAKGEFLANAAQASRKDARDAVVGGPQGVPRLVAADGVQPRPGPLPDRRDARGPARPVRRRGRARRGRHRGRPGVVDAAIDRLVWYAGWADKIAQVHGAANPVAGPYFNLSAPEPTGVVAVIAPQEAPLLGLVSVVAPVIVTGNTVVVVAARSARCPRSRWPRCWPPPTCPAASSTSSPGQPPRSRRGSPSHMDVNAIDLTGAPATPVARPARPRPPRTSSASRARQTTDWARRRRACTG